MRSPRWQATRAFIAACVASSACSSSFAVDEACHWVKRVKPKTLVQRTVKPPAKAASAPTATPLPHRKKKGLLPRQPGDEYDLICDELPPPTLLSLLPPPDVVLPEQPLVMAPPPAAPLPPACDCVIAPADRNSAGAGRGSGLGEPAGKRQGGQPPRDGRGGAAASGHLLRFAGRARGQEPSRDPAGGRAGQEGGASQP